MKNFRTLFLGGSVALTLVCLQTQAAPANDNFASRTILNGTNVTVQGFNGDAGSEPGEDSGGGNIYYFYSVWYGWTSPTNGVVHISGGTSVPNFIMSVRVFRGDAVGALTLAPRTPDGGVAVAPGDGLVIEVASIYYTQGGGGSGAGEFTLGLSLEVPTPTSPNDAFTDRLEITTPTYHFDGGIYGATNEPGEPLPPGGGAQTLWWRFSAPEDCNLNVVIFASQFTPSLTIYEGTNFGSLLRINPLTGSIYRLQSGKEYSVQMATGYVPGGGFSLDTRCYSLTNDMFTGSAHLEGTNVTFYGNFTAATHEPNEPLLAATNTVWASWAAPCTGRVRFSLASAPFSQYCAVYTGPSVDRLQAVAIVSAGNRVSSFLAIEGTVYQFQFAGGANNFIFSLSVEPLLPCTNDNFADAQIVMGRVIYFDPKSVLGATMELGEPAHMGATPQKSLWWSWQAPTSGSFYLNASGSLVPNVVLAVYTGDSVEALTLVGKGAGTLLLPVIGGQTYRIAGAVATNAVGDILNYGQMDNNSSASRIVLGNLLQEPSWEGTGVVGAQYWHWSAGIGGYINESGGADGTTWPSLSVGGTLWQDIPTVPGHEYAIQFAYFIGGGQSGCCGDAQVEVSWNGNHLGSANIPAAEAGFWHWADFTTRASNTTSRVFFHNVLRNLDMDAFSVVDLSAPPVILNQPASISTVSGGTAGYIVGAKGSAPLEYQWYFNGAVLPGETNWFLVLNSVSTNQAGHYLVTLTNAFGSVTSAPASLYVDAPFYPTIVWEPYGDTVAPGAYYSFNVAAIGTLPLFYAWFFNGVPITGATNNSLVFTNVAAADASIYQVTVQNAAGTVWSLPATLRISNTILGGGQVVFGNHDMCGTSNPDARVFDIDNVTPLNGAGYFAQLYAGPSLALLRPAGQPVPFRSGFGAGFVVSQIVTLPNVAPGSNAIVQVRAWDAAKGNTYEEARAFGGGFGKSDLLSVTVGGGLQPPQCLAGLRGFGLQTGLPQFTVGLIQFVERQAPDTVVWAVTGQAGFRYLIEKTGHNFIWQPYVVVTNASGTVTFTDSASSGSDVTFYRARILD